MFTSNMIKIKRFKLPWTDLRIEVKKARERLKIDESTLREVNISHWDEIEQNIWKRFSTRKNSRWIWESLHPPYYSFYIENYKLLNLTELIDQSETVWFLLDETVNEKTKFWIYEGLISSFDRVIWECYYIDEILIVSKKYKWLISINHHDYIIGTGIMSEKLKQLENKINTASNN